MDSLRALRKDGRLVTCGGHAGETPPIDIIELFRNEWQVHRLAHRHAPPRCSSTMQLMGEGKLAAAVHAAIPLAEAARGAPHHRSAASRPERWCWSP